MAILSATDPDVAAEFPWLTGAIEYIQQMGLATPKSYSRMIASIQQKTLSVDQVDSISVLADMRDALKDAVAKGQSRENFKKTIDAIATTKKGEAERILRTTSKQAYMDQWSKTQDRPAVKRAFGYVVYRATRDGRTRPWHRALDGFCCSVDDPAYKVLLEIQAEYNCRCILTALTETQAKRIGIKTSKDLPNIEALRSAA